MKVLGYDPQITVQRAWQLSSSVEQALSLDDLFVRSDLGLNFFSRPQQRHRRRGQPGAAAERQLAEDDRPDDSVVRTGQRSGKMDHCDKRKHHDSDQQAGPADRSFGGDAQGRRDQSTADEIDPARAPAE